MSKGTSENEPKKAWEAWKRQQSKQIEQSMPLSKQDLRGLFDFLKRKNVPPCDHTLEETIRFLRERNLPADKILPWLRQQGGFRQQGGYCDCEVIYNVEDKFRDLVRAV